MKSTSVSLCAGAFCAMAMSAGAWAAGTAAPAAATASAPAAAASKSMGYGVKLGGFFTPQHKEVARKSYARYYAKNKECPKDMQRSGKTCKSLVQGHYWAIGQSLQKAVEPQPVPEPVRSALPPPPEGYDYVRAGDDVLLISTRLHLVVDMMEDVAAG